MPLCDKRFVIQALFYNTHCKLLKLSRFSPNLYAGRPFFALPAQIKNAEPLSSHGIFQRENIRRFSFSHLFPANFCVTHTPAVFIPLMLKCYKLFYFLCRFYIIGIKHRTLALILRCVFILNFCTDLYPLFRFQKTGISCLAHKA